MSLVLVTAPTAYPVTLAEALNHLRVTDTAEHALIDALIATATKTAEDFTGRAIVTQTWDWKVDCWRDILCNRGPLPPWQSVESISYIDSAGATQTWDSANYQTDLDEWGARIALAYGKVLPTLRGGDLNAVTVRFVAGRDAGDPRLATFREAILRLVHHWYQERRPVGVAQLAEMPFQVSALLGLEKVWSFGA